MVVVALVGGDVVVRDAERVLTPAQKSMLAIWRFRLRGPDGLVATMASEAGATLAKLLEYLDDQGVPYGLGETAQAALEEHEVAARALRDAVCIGSKMKTGRSMPSSAGFLRFAREELPRRLRWHQEKAAEFMLSVANSANFSVPGSGKSSVVLAAFAWLRRHGECQSLFVVGPRSCFAPWRQEYEATLGKAPRLCSLAGLPEAQRRELYYPEAGGEADLYLCTYQTLWRDSAYVRDLFRHSANGVFFVVDEAHYVKRADGEWAKAVLSVSRRAARRCVLTGTPFPHSYADAISLFEISYPDVSPFSHSVAEGIRTHSVQGQHDEARRLLEPAIGSLYYRVRKKDLNLSDPVFLPSVAVPMNTIERHLYDVIVQRIRGLSELDAVRDAVTVSKLRRGRLIRLRQVLSNSALLGTVIDHYDEDLLGEDESLADLIATYSRRETPGKVSALLELVEGLRERGEKVVVWSHFVGTLYLLQERFADCQWPAEVVCGRTPTTPGTGGDTRDSIVERFKRAGSGLDILVANPAACGESISLHRTCSNAIYYDLSYNCAEYLQSLDRIHRVGGSEGKASYYHYLQYADTFEGEVLRNVSEKAERMAVVLDVDLPYCDIELPDVADLAYDMVTQ